MKTDRGRRKLYKSDIRRMIKRGLIDAEGTVSVDEMAEFQYFALNETPRPDGFLRFATIGCSAATEGWALVCLHPNLDTLVFGYVTGCFYPVLLREDYVMTDEEIFRGGKCHPEYAYLERCGVVPPNQRG